MIASVEQLILEIDRGEMPLIDVRSPCEFVKGKIPRALNVPLFNDEERHRVGLCYHEEGQGEATRLGLELFADRCACFLDDIERVAPRGSKVAVHCWRGGMRSQAVALLLANCGWEPVVVRGGYKAFRQFVMEALEAMTRHQWVVLHGRTGSGKTDLLKRFPADFPLIDIEGLAHHRGSAFGDFCQEFPCPTQQDFENRLALAYTRVRHAPTILVEIEDRLGENFVSSALRARFYASPFVVVDRDFEDRVGRLAREYCRLWKPETTQLFLERMELLKKHISAEERERITRAVESGDFETAVRRLLETRYDRMYDKQIRRHESQIEARFNLTSEEDRAVEWLTKRVLERSS